MPARSPRRRFTAAALPVVAVLLVLGACRGSAADAVQSKETRSLSLAGTTARLVRVEVFNGGIVVRAGAAGAVTASVEVTGAGASRADADADRASVVTTLTEDADGAILRAVYRPRPDSPGNRGASATLTVPADVSLRLETSNGAVDVAGIGGAIDIRTSNGEVTVDGATAGLVVRTSNGGITVSGSRGSLDVETSNARITMTGADAAVVRAGTSNGAISFAGALGDGAQSFETSNATIDLQLPADAAFGLDLATTNATIAVDFAVWTSGAASPTHLQGRVGADPAAAIRATTSNAAITIRPS